MRFRLSNRRLLSTPSCWRRSRLQKNFLPEIIFTQEWMAFDTSPDWDKNVALLPKGCETKSKWTISSKRNNWLKCSSCHTAKLTGAFQDLLKTKTTFKMLEIHYLRQEHWRHLTAIFRPNWCFPQLFTTAGIGTNLLIVCKSKCTSIVSLFDNTDNCYYQTVCRWHSLQNSSSMNFIWWTKPYIVCIMYKPMDMHF